MNHFCTISTQSHLFKTLALADSLKQFDTHMHVLVIDAEVVPDDTNKNVSYYTLKTIKNEIGLRLIAKYRKHADKLRWALKSVFILYLLEQTNKVIYVDNDIYFFSNPGFLFDSLDKSSILLTPHFYDANPNQNQNWLEANFKVGLYNAGFIGANKNATKAIQWWSECCLYNIKKSYWRGLFDDQKYLDLLPVLFNDVTILKHKGCNLAGWNYILYKLDRKNNNDIQIELEHQLVFIHFAEMSMVHFAKSDNFFYPEYLTYEAHLRKYNSAFINKRSYLKTYNVSVYLYFIKWKISRLLEG